RDASFDEPRVASDCTNSPCLAASSPRSEYARAAMHYALFLLFVVAFAQGCSPRSDGSEVAALRREVEALKQDVHALKAQLSAVARSPDSSALPREGTPEPISDQDTSHKSDTHTVTWRFEVEPSPSGVTVTVDGVPVEGAAWQGPSTSSARQIEVRKPGYRIVREFAVPDRDRTLRYVLTPGRGVQHVTGR